MTDGGGRWSAAVAQVGGAAIVQVGGVAVAQVGGVAVAQVGGVAVAQVGEAVGVLEVQPDSSSQLPLVPAG